MLFLDMEVSLRGGSFRQRNIGQCPFLSFCDSVDNFSSSLTKMFITYYLGFDGCSSTACPVNFERQNYTIITSQCKEPDYSPKPCCSAFKEFACPFADELNDLSNVCAETMFNYISKHGIPQGLFASLCREGKDGLKCPDEPASPPSSSPSEKSADSSASERRTCQLWTAAMLIPATLVLSLLQFM